MNDRVIRSIRDDYEGKSTVELTFSLQRAEEKSSSLENETTEVIRQILAERGGPAPQEELREWVR